MTVHFDHLPARERVTSREQYEHQAWGGPLARIIGELAQDPRAPRHTASRCRAGTFAGSTRLPRETQGAPTYNGNQDTFYNSRISRSRCAHCCNFSRSLELNTKAF